MIEALSNISFGLAVGVGILLIGGFLALANLTDRRNVAYPGGRRGRVRDDLIGLAPFAPILAMTLVGAAFPVLRELDWWFPALCVAFGACFAGMFLPVVRRARARVLAFRHAKDPAQ